MSSASPDRDFTQIAVPQSWLDAAEEAPFPDELAFYEADPVGRPVVPNVGLQLFTGMFATAAMAMVAGTGWFLLHTRDLLTTPWTAVALGLVLAFALRAGAGPAEPHTRMVIALLVYLVTAGVVIVLIASHDYRALYGSSPSLAQLERELLYSSLFGLQAWSAWISGAATAALVSRFS